MDTVFFLENLSVFQFSQLSQKCPFEPLSPAGQDAGQGYALP